MSEITKLHERRKFMGRKTSPTEDAPPWVSNILERVNCVIENQERFAEELGNFGTLLESKISEFGKRLDDLEAKKSG